MSMLKLKNLVLNRFILFLCCIYILSIFEHSFCLRYHFVFLKIVYKLYLKKNTLCRLKFIKDVFYRLKLVAKQNNFVYTLLLWFQILYI